MKETPMACPFPEADSQLLSMRAFLSICFVLFCDSFVQCLDDNLIIVVHAHVLLACLMECHKKVSFNISSCSRSCVYVLTSQPYTQAA